MPWFCHLSVCLAVWLSIWPSICPSASLCIVAKWYILQQECQNKWIGSALLGTRCYNFQCPITPHPQTPHLLHHRRWCHLANQLDTYAVTFTSFHIESIFTALTCNAWQHEQHSQWQLYFLFTITARLASVQSVQYSALLHTLETAVPLYIVQSHVYKEKGCMMYTIGWWAPEWRQCS